MLKNTEKEERERKKNNFIAKIMNTIVLEHLSKREERSERGREKKQTNKQKSASLRVVDDPVIPINGSRKGLERKKNSERNILGGFRMVFFETKISTGKMRIHHSEQTRRGKRKEFFFFPQKTSFFHSKLIFSYLSSLTF